MNLVRSSPFKVLSAIEFQTAVASFPDISLSAGLRLKTRSQRTKAALSAAKARGQKLGNPNISAAREAGATALEANADRHAANVLPIIAEIQKSGAQTLRAIADALNARGIPTP
jgi:DNA invertase Pin-like site-specific DNA recombinase